MPDVYLLPQPRGLPSGCILPSQADTVKYQKLYQDFFSSVRLTGAHKPDPSTGLLGGL